MNKKITVFAVILIVIGIIGTISSAVNAVPFATNYVNEIIKKANEEVKIYEKKVDINKLYIETKNLNVEIRKSDSDKLIIKQVGNLSTNSFTIDENNKEFKIKSNNENKYLDSKIQGFGDAILNMINNSYNKIIVFVPNHVDIKVRTSVGDLIVENKDVLLNKIEFNTSQGQIILPKESKNLENLKISSMGTINLKVSELLGIKNIDISTQDSVYIESTPDDIFVDNIESFIPESINIITSSRDFDTIDIKSNIPIAKNLNIDNKSGNVYLDLPVDRYNIHFDLNSLKGIHFDNENQDVESDKLINKFEGSFRDQKENELKYNVYVNSDNINVYKK
ncbi:MAG: DUF4097 family beta strand repeat-containing protein [Paeniclostridium sordellii]|uniref:DUF4097 family beta strand repeat protein n=1 Tax=Paeniclostridium hominis TaxID=2764329 RepID=A0ABR7K4I6_9FIRM|nr:MULTISPECIES: DUF4097 family beta strand repeat-containing protein [Paeniclostridium]MBC6003769.1 DUF4097 family beta strand repeat protein [Paeniclostridium hominis]MDU2591633.1 DUF4097 family beta strand repeat-containing protein [Paeniclostridium sordellii]